MPALSKFHRIAARMLVALSLGALPALATAADSYTGAGTYSWTAPAGVTSVDVEVWGAGGAGGGNPTNQDGGGGGGGGGYSKVVNLAVVPGNTYTVTVGAGGTGGTGNGNAGGDSWFNSTITVLAKGGNGGTAPTGGTGGAGGAGGAAAAGIGAIKFSGGDGGTGRNSNTGRGGPGGSSAGTAANGTSGPTVWATAIAAAAPAGGGIGGDGGNANRQNGFAPASGNGGGGGGGAERNTTGGNGADGQVIISYVSAPLVTTDPASAITASGATLNGTISSNGASTTASFEYGLTTAYGYSATAAQSPLATTAAATPVSAAVSGLICGTTYHYRAKGVNSAGTTYGSDATFTTGACVATVTPTNCTDVAGIGTQPWTTAATNQLPATTSLSSATTTSHYLVCSGYNLNIPGNATINGIVVGVSRYNAARGNAQDAAMRLVDATGTIGTTDRSTTTIYPTNTTVGVLENHGTATDLWGATWTPADINSANFGAAFAATYTGNRTSGHTIGVDAMPITVYYSVPSTLSVLSMTAADPNPATSGTAVSWTVTFSDSVTGVDAADFALATTGVTGASISSVTGSGTTWTVTANSGSGTGTLGLNLIDNDTIVNGVGDKLGGTGIGNGNFTGDVYTIEAPMSCVGGTFTSTTLDPSLWTVRTIAGAFTPAIVDVGGGDFRLRLTDTGGNEATFAQLVPTFPGAGNKVVLEFDYFAYGGTGADGIAVTFSDASISSTTGGFGGSLGYAQNTTAGAAGFGGGWMGIGLDEYGNYPCNNEGRTGYPAGWVDPVLGAGAAVCTGSAGATHYVAIRGSGSGTTGYNLLANTGVIAATAPASGTAGTTPYRYRVTLDHSDNVHAWVTVERDTTGTGNSYTTLIPKFDIKGANSGQVAVPASWLVSFTGSTGGATNFHELKHVRVCANTVAGAGPHHLEIQHPSGTGLTCTPSTLTIQACADGNNPCTPYTGGVTGTLSATGSATVNWTGGNSFSIPSGSSSVTKDVQVTTPNSAVIFDATGTPTPNSATTCSFGGCSFTAYDTGFLVSAPNHVAETSSTLTVQAVKKADNSLACAPAFGGQSKSVNLQCAYNNPGSGTLPVRIGGTALNATANATAACDATGANVTLAFDANGIATPSLQYADVGKVDVTAAYTGTAGTSEAGLSMTGTGSFIAAPASFSFSNIPTGTTIKAGAPFSATVSALNNAGAVTPNFGKEATAESVTLTSTLVTPPAGTTGAHNPAIGNNLIPGSEFGTGGMVTTDANGVATVTNLNWGEVGDIALTANLTSASYLGSGLTASGTSGTAGRFVPDHFNTSVVLASGVPMPCPSSQTCPPIYNGAAYRGFVYSGQPTGNGQPFNVNIEAQNAANATTTNYDTAFSLSKQVTLTAWTGTGPGATTAAPGILNNASVPASSFHSGTTAGDSAAIPPIPATSATPDFAFSTTPTAPTDIYIRAADANAISSSVEGGVKVVSGRTLVSNGYGSQLLPLPLVATVQYYDGANWATSATDDVTSLNFATSYDIFNSAGTKTGTTSPSPTSGTVIGGILNFLLAAPGGNVTGNAAIATTVPTYLPPVPGQATFGVYKSNAPLIYMREN